MKKYFKDAEKSTPKKSPKDAGPCPCNRTDLWHDYIDYRQKSERPLTAQSAQELIKRLWVKKKQGHDIDARVLEAMAKDTLTIHFKAWQVAPRGKSKRTIGELVSAGLRQKNILDEKPMALEQKQDLIDVLYKVRCPVVIDGDFDEDIQGKAGYTWRKHRRTDVDLEKEKRELGSLDNEEDIKAKEAEISEKLIKSRQKLINKVKGIERRPAAYVDYIAKISRNEAIRRPSAAWFNDWMTRITAKESQRDTEIHIGAQDEEIDI